MKGSAGERLAMLSDSLNKLEGKCHTCFVKLPIATAAIVTCVLLLSGCSGPMVSTLQTMHLISEL